MIGIIRVHSQNLTRSLPLSHLLGQPSVALPPACHGARLWFKCVVFGQLGRISSFGFPADQDV
jgi:hypothetical protein